MEKDLTLHKKDRLGQKNKIHPSGKNEPKKERKRLPAPLRVGQRNRKKKIIMVEEGPQDQKMGPSISKQKSEKEKEKP